MKKKTALIFGVTGQDGAYLSKLLLNKGYLVHGVKRKSSSINTDRINDIYEEDFKKNKKFFLHYGDVIDANSTNQIIQKILPDEIYNLAAQSHVAVSFELPEYTSKVNALGVLNVLESIKNLSSVKKIKFYQASTSEMFGNSNLTLQNEKTPFEPESPYAISKLYGYWITKNYRSSYNLFAANGILFNHESPLRGETFVTKKIIKALCKIKLKKQKQLVIGNLYSKRDWGHAEDYVIAMWKILQQKKPDDFVISTNSQITVKKFINLTASILKLKINWRGKGLGESAYDQNNNKIIICAKKYFRPAEVNSLKGDFSKAKKILKWKPKKNILDLIKEMIDFEMRSI